MANKDNVLKYIEEKYSIKPDFPFKRFKNYAVLRHYNNKKWFGLIMDVSCKQIGRDGNDVTWIMDVKAEPEIQELVLAKPKSIYLPAYHMNKTHWLSIILTDNDDSDQLTYQLIDDSYRLTK